MTNMKIKHHSQFLQVQSTVPLTTMGWSVRNKNAIREGLGVHGKKTDIRIMAGGSSGKGQASR